MIKITQHDYAPVDDNLCVCVCCLFKNHIRLIESS